MMMCSTLPYPVMTPQIEDIMRTAPLSFKENTLVKDFLTKAKENMQLIEEQKRRSKNASVGGQNRMSWIRQWEYSGIQHSVCHYVLSARPRSHHPFILLRQCTSTAA